MIRINSRHLAIEILLQLQKSHTPLPVVLDRLCSRFHATATDRAFAMNLVYGVLRQREYLELIIKELSRTKLSKLHPFVRQALLVGLYQLLFLTRTPPSATVNETVRAVKKGAPLRLAGFVNGILREATRQKEKLPSPDSVYSMTPPLLNHPKWMTSRWQARFGSEETIAICRANNIQPPLTLRCNLTKTSAPELRARLQEQKRECEPGQFAEEALLLPGFQGQIASLPGYREGLFQVQGEAAQLAVHLLGKPLSSGRYLDACAGLGGKTTHLLEMFADSEAELVALEPEAHRFALLEQIKPAGARTEFTALQATLEEYAEKSPQLFDGILLDAPCTGSGVLARQPDIRWRRREEDIPRYAERQLQLLKRAAMLLQPGGVLVYATCSIEEEENCGVVTAFLREFPECTLEDAAEFLPAKAQHLIRCSCFAPRPSDGLDGFFAARIARNRKRD